MGLFDIDDPQAALGYRNIRAGASEIEAEIKAGLEALWVKYEPYADTNFLQAFSEAPDDRFWEMYLAVRLLDAGKKLRKRADLTKASRDKGPDVCISETSHMTLDEPGDYGGRPQSGADRRHYRRYEKGPCATRQDSDGHAQCRKTGNADAERGRQVLHEASRGRFNKQIAFDLGISEVTVKLYLSNVMRKMQAASIGELIRIGSL
jgi:DNA-binding CsgD family transcriptional regulator